MKDKSGSREKWSLQARGKGNRRSDYTRLKGKIYAWVVLIVAIAFAVIFFLRALVRGHFGDFLVRFFQSSFHMDYVDAHNFYQGVVRNNLTFFLFLLGAIFLIILAYFLIARFTKYLDEVNGGLDILMDPEKGKVITLSPEMGFLEHKMNTVRMTLEKREQEAKLAEQKKNELVTYLAHDIRTPLTSVVGYLSLLEEAPELPMELRAKYTHIGLEKAYRLERLIDEFFEITRYNLQTMILYKREIDLSYMLAQLADELYPQLVAQNKKIEIHAKEDLRLYGDPDKLARAFNNILKNAIAYGTGNSVISVEVEIEHKFENKSIGGFSVGFKEEQVNDTPDILVIRFKNAGSIPKEKLASIFEKFYRMDDARSTDRGGAGLGLAIAKEILLLHGGEIHAESGGGETVFTVELPAFPQQNSGGF